MTRHTRSLFGGMQEVNMMCTSRGESWQAERTLSPTGWAVGDLDMDDNHLRTIAVELKLAIVNVDYRSVTTFDIVWNFLRSDLFPGWPQNSPSRLRSRTATQRSNGCVYGPRSPGMQTCGSNVSC